MTFAIGEYNPVTDLAVIGPEDGMYRVINRAGSNVNGRPLTLAKAEKVRDKPVMKQPKPNRRFGDERS